jgi:hypothetical protein
VIRIDVLPDDVLLEIFEFYMIMHPSAAASYGEKPRVEAWQLLVHVCRQWRNLVLGSPRRLNLRLYCTPKTPARDTLDVWPALPLIVTGDMAISSGTDNTIAALGQSNRVCQVILRGFDWQLEKVLATVQVPFPELTDLRVFSYGETMPVIPDLFLGGSVPRLRVFELDGIPFPGLPNLLSSATHLVHLKLSNIPHSGYFSPEALVALISVLSTLETLSLGFQSPQSRPRRESRSLPILKRSIPALGRLDFKGVTEYLEELMTRIDTPQLNALHITFFNQIDFYCPQLTQYINRIPTLRALDEAHVQLGYSTASVKLRYWTSEPGFDNLLISILCREPDWQLSSIEQFCNSSLHPVSTVEDLYIERQFGELVRKDDAFENIRVLWLQLFLPFTAVKNLYISKEFAPDIADALQELVGARITEDSEVLPSLQNIFVEGLESWGPIQKNIGQFVATRQLSGHPVMSIWDK